MAMTIAYGNDPGCDEARADRDGVRNTLSELKPSTPHFRTIVVSMMRSVLKEWVPLYLFSKLAMDSALASDTPTMPMK